VRSTETDPYITIYSYCYLEIKERLIAVADKVKEHFFVD